ncbi:TetR/AcrR family transcriptional regulator [Micromonospora harpali]|uniref:TetR/AcrR family transcriptional regulator n=1 Tax=Micromonospora harpali TaxID=1490225 RepID=A0ABW1HQ66_9ACTN
MSTSRSGPFHHGNLPHALLDAGMELLLASGEPGALSLREVARRAGVSANAPYRHYADKDALLTALAVRGYDALAECLSAADGAGGAAEAIPAMAEAYVRFALDRPGLFRLMYAYPCGRSNAEALAAAARCTAVIEGRLAREAPAGRRPAALLATWSLVHGLASLLLEGRIVVGPGGLAELVRATVAELTPMGAGGGADG